MNNNILVLGYFGYGTTQFNGQTIKTRNVYELLKLKSKDHAKVCYFDTYQFQHTKYILFEMILSLIRCKKLVYIPAQNNLKYIFPLIYIICKLRKIDILYIVIGGWLDEWLETKRLHVSLLSKIRGIFSESNQLSLNLKKKYHFNNVVTFPNFRIHSFIPSLKNVNSDFKIVFMARISRMKGIDSVFRLAKHFSQVSGLIYPIEIHFYGPIAKCDEEYFYSQVEKFDNISYQGILPADKIYETLTQYDLVILPTRYFTEGFPGTILDAYISGVPVIASRWKYATEFVDHGKSGFLFDLNKEEEFYFYVDKLYKDRSLLLEMKKNAFEKSKIYSTDSSWSIIKKYLIS